MKQVVSKCDLNVLNCLRQNNCISPMKSFTIKEIAENTNLSNSRVRYTVKPLLAGGFIGEGYSTGNASTHWITPKGINELAKTEEG